MIVIITFYRFLSGTNVWLSSPLEPCSPDALDSQVTLPFLGPFLRI